MRKLILILTLMSFVFLVGCNDKTASDRQEEKRDNLMDRANTQVPIPTINNFVARKAVSEYMRRMDEANKLFYLYVIADTGNIIGYFVARTQTVNICTFMAPTDRISRKNGKYWQRQAPANDGLYYGDGSCNVDYFFDAESNALIQIKGLNLFISDQPLDVEVEAFRVKATN